MLTSAPSTPTLWRARIASLLDAAYQVRLTYEPIYRPVLDHCMSELLDSARLDRQVTRMMRDLEDLGREPERAARFDQIRDAIGIGVNLGSAAQ